MILLYIYIYLKEDDFVHTNYATDSGDPAIWCSLPNIVQTNTVLSHLQTLTYDIVQSHKNH